MKNISWVIVAVLVITNIILVSSNIQLKKEIKLSDELAGKLRYNLELQDKLLVINEEIITMQSALLSD